MTEKDMKRKIKYRLMALEYGGSSAVPVEDSQSAGNCNAVFQSAEYCDGRKIDDIYRYIDESWANHDMAAASSSMLDGYNPLYGSRFKIFLKKVLRKLLKIFLGWYIFPIYRRQSEFNGKIDNAVSALIITDKEQTGLLSGLISENRQLANKLEEMDKEMQQYRVESDAKIAELLQCIGILKGETEEKFSLTDNIVNAKYGLLTQRVERLGNEMKKGSSLLTQRINRLGNKIKEKNSLLQQHIDEYRNESAEQVLAALKEVESDIIQRLEKGEWNIRLANEKYNLLEQRVGEMGNEAAERESLLQQRIEEYRDRAAEQTQVVSEELKSAIMQRLDRGEDDMQLIKSKLNITYDPKLIDSDLVDYFDFEDRFRGSRQDIISRQTQYVQFLKGGSENGYVLDLGCGRGEILEILQVNGIAAKGVDCYEPFVKYNMDRGFDVVLGDALTVLSECEDNSLNGIVLSQVAEHVSADCLYQMIRTGYRKLRVGCCFIIETPNPEVLSTYTNFYVDGSHIKPVQFHALWYFFEANRYSEVIRLGDEYSNHPYFERFRTLFIEHCADEEKKALLAEINQTMFGACDYTIIARK